MDAATWKYFCDGISVAQIRKKKQVRLERTEKNRDINCGVFDIVDIADNIDMNEFFVIKKDVHLFPELYSYFNKEGLWFIEYIREKLRNPKKEKEQKKTLEGYYSRKLLNHGKRLRLKVGRQGDRIRDRLGLHKLAKDIIEHDYMSLTKDESNYDKIVFGGLEWRDTFNENKVIRFPDNMKAWRIAAYIIDSRFPIWYSHPGKNFEIRIPSSKRNPNDKKNHHMITLSNFAVHEAGGWHYSKWVNIEGNLEVNEDSEVGADLYSNMHDENEKKEFVLNFQILAASILRQHFNDTRRATGETDIKPAVGHTIEPAEVNVALPPKQDMIRYDYVLHNNFLKEYIDLNGNISLRKLNKGEEQCLDCVRVYSRGFNNCFYVDDRLDCLDLVVDMICKENFI